MDDEAYDSAPLPILEPNFMYHDGTKYDFLIVTALEEEFDAVRSAYKNEPVNPIKLPFPGRVVEIRHRHKSGEIVFGLLASPFSIGAVDSAIITSHLLSKYKFRIATLTGILAAIKSEKSNTKPFLGDVIFADMIFDLNIVRTYDSNSVQYEVRHELSVSKLRSFATSQTLNYKLEKFIKTKHFDGDYLDNLKYLYDYARKPTIFRGSTISANAVVGSEQDVERIMNHISHLTQSSPPIAIEMEGFGVARAIDFISPNTEFFMCKAVNDYADSSKSSDENHIRRIACQNAALAAKSFIDYTYSH